jgi:2-(1,2-epoxy-1,2-dihydrophenyl)acetyl-CoA isomerase
MARVLFDHERGVARVTLNRAERGNTLDLETARELFDAASRCRNEGARAVLLRGSGKHFCLGGDVRIPERDDTAMQAHVLDLTRTLNAAVLAFMRLQAPVVAVVSGGVAGAGVGLVGMADLAIAAQSAYFLPAFTTVGMTPDTGTSVWLSEIVGRKRAAELLLTNRRLSAVEAVAWGLVNFAVPDVELEAASGSLARRLADGPLGAFGATKRLLVSSIDRLESRLELEARYIARQRISKEGKEGIHAYQARRPADFLANTDAAGRDDLL